MKMVELPKMKKADMERQKVATTRTLTKNIKLSKDPQHGKQARKKILLRIDDAQKRLATISPAV
jgi:hypothetical protein